MTATTKAAALAAAVAMLGALAVTGNTWAQILLPVVVGFSGAVTADHIERKADRDAAQP